MIKKLPALCNQCRQEKPVFNSLKREEHFPNYSHGQRSQCDTSVLPEDIVQVSNKALNVLLVVSDILRLGNY